MNIKIKKQYFQILNQLDKNKLLDQWFDYDNMAKYLNISKEESKQIYDEWCISHGGIK